MTIFTLSLYHISGNHFESHQVNFEYCLCFSVMSVHINCFNILACISWKLLDCLISFPGTWTYLSLHSWVWLTALQGAALICSHRPSLPKFHLSTQHWEVKRGETQTQSLNKITFLAVTFPEPQFWDLTKRMVKWSAKNNVSIWQFKSA